MKYSLDNIAKITIDRVKDNFKQTANDIKKKSIENCPKNTGKLAGSHKVDIKESTDQLDILISVTAKYATIVHETNKNYKSGSWKFLEHAIDEIKEEFKDILKDE